MIRLLYSSTSTMQRLEISKQTNAKAEETNLDLQKHLSLASLTQPCVMLQKFLIMKKSKVSATNALLSWLNFCSLCTYANVQLLHRHCCKPFRCENICEGSTWWSGNPIKLKLFLWKETFLKTPTRSWLNFQ